VWLALHLLIRTSSTRADCRSTLPHNCILLGRVSHFNVGNARRAAYVYSIVRASHIYPEYEKRRDQAMLEAPIGGKAAGAIPGRATEC
jgi:hypothetical protein